jgi:hypothetical protein
MTTTPDTQEGLAERIARLRELDAKRTPGDWFGIAISPKNPTLSAYGYLEGPRAVDIGGATYFCPDDALFLGGATEMMETITALEAENAELRRRLEVARVAVESCCDDPWDGMRFDESARDNALVACDLSKPFDAEGL